MAAAVLVSALSIPSTCVAQDRVAQSRDDSSRSSLKPALPSRGIKGPDGRVTDASRSEGDTYVALASGLERVFRGYEPRDAGTLKLLQEQQKKVIDSIEKVTVNIQQGLAQGSGVIITPSGYILTAAHVAGRPGQKANVVFSDGRQFEAVTLGMNRNKDAGLMRITSKTDQPWPHASLGSVKGNVREGQWCVAAGFPGGFHPGREAYIRVGRILRVLTDSDDDPHTILTDCALIGGDSGGPLFGLDGKLVAIHSRIGSSITENMHVPVDVFSDGWDRMLAGEVWGTLPGYKPLIGVIGSDEDPRALIESVEPNGPAARAGIQAGDLIVSVDGKDTPTFRDLQKVVLEALPGDMLRIIVERNGQRLRANVRVAAGG